jgi:hypothetical protein
LTSTTNNILDKRITGKIRPATLIQLHKLGFNPLPLSIDNEVVIPWTPVHENPNYWSAEKLIAEFWKFKNVATVFGNSHVKDEKGLELYLNGFDCDSDYVNQILNSDQIQDPIIRDKVQNLISKSGSKSLFDFLVRNTVVVKTRKEFAYYNDCLDLEIMKYIALYSEMDYYRCCHTNVSQWYANIYKNMIKRGECLFEYNQNNKISKLYIAGGTQGDTVCWYETLSGQNNRTYSAKPDNLNLE